MSVATQSMRAWQAVSTDGPEALQLNKLPQPDAADKVVIDVHAAGVSYPELLLTQGRYQIKPELPFVPGTEVAGTVRSAPAQSRFRTGERVAAFTWFGGFADVAAADPVMVMSLPDTLGFDQGAALMMNYQTAYFALQRRGRLKAGETVVVQGAAGGLGTAAIQIAQGLGAHVIAVVSDEAKAATARQAGAGDILVLAPGWPAEVRERTGGRGADIIFDPVGGDRFADTLRCVAPEGRVLVVGFAAGEIPTVKVNLLLLRHIDLVGVAWGPFLTHEPNLPAEISGALEGLIEQGHIQPVVGARYPMEQAPRALMDLEQRRARGKIVLTMR